MTIALNKYREFAKQQNLNTTIKNPITRCAEKEGGLIRSILLCSILLAQTDIIFIRIDTDTMTPPSVVSNNLQELLRLVHLPDFEYSSIVLIKKRLSMQNI